jgi:uncharacterized protein
VFTRQGNYALFNSLLLSLVFLEERFLKLINELKWGSTIEHLCSLDPEAPAIIDELVRQQLVVPINYNDNLLLKEKQESYIRPPSLETLYLLVTDSCNLACRYCLINCNMPDEYRRSVMSWTTAKEAVDMYFSNLEKTKFKKTIVFYGGEPLLNFPIIRKVVEYIKSTYQDQQREYGVLFTIITNGVLINYEIAKFLAEHTDIAVAVSLDGGKEINDQKRIFPNGAGTFDHVRSGIKMLKAAGRDDVCISATVDEHNIDQMGDILELHQELFFAAVSFNLLLDTQEKIVDPAYTKKATDNLLVYFEKAREIGLYEDRIMRKVKAMSNGVLHPHDCQATGEQLVCSPDGKLGVCHEGLGCRDFFFGEVSRDFKFSTNELICEWKKRSPLTMPQCQNCPALGICGGGCTYSAYLRHGTIWAVDEKFCGHSLTILEWIIWDIFSRM